MTRWDRGASFLEVNAKKPTPLSFESARDEAQWDPSASSLAEDAEDLAAFADRENEPDLDFEAFVRDLASSWPSRKAS